MVTDCNQQFVEKAGVISDFLLEKQMLQTTRKKKLRLTTD